VHEETGEFEIIGPTHERREGRMRRVDSAEVTMIRTWRAHGLRGAGLREGAYAEGRTSSFLP
jgi:hypothetical protein